MSAKKRSMSGKELPITVDQTKLQSVHDAINIPTLYIQ